MSERILITGGAGFIGSHLADALLEQGHQVTVFDSLHPQVHGQSQATPGYLNPGVRLIRGDVRDREALAPVVADADSVFHFAAYTGVGQSMYRIQEYLDVNVSGTAVLMELLSQGSHTLRRLVLASSRAIYGEGAYECERCGIVYPVARTNQQLRDGHWEVRCPTCQRKVSPIPTPETKPAAPASVYGISKLTQEQMCMLVSGTYDLPAVSLRFFNVYGPRQSLLNPYTGVIGTFITRLMNHKPPLVYEDGKESRDFVHVDDVVEACLLAWQKEEAIGRIFNVGLGKPISLLEIAQTIATELGGPDPLITGQYRAGDIRHCYADLALAKRLLGYQPQISFAAGIKDLIQRLSGEQWEDLSSLPEKELIERRLSARM